MDQPCELYFFIKTSFKKPEGTMHPLKTVIYNVAKVKSESTKGKADTQTLKIGVTRAMRVDGILAWLFGVEVSYFEVPGGTKERALELMDDPTWTFRNDAVTLSLHAITVELKDEQSKELYCEMKS